MDQSTIDRSWMYAKNLKRHSTEYRKGVINFMNAAEEDRKRRNSDYMCCPCADCKNENMFDSGEDVHGHQIQRGFMKGYTCWVKHGEQELESGASADRSGAYNQEDEDELDMLIPSPLGDEMVDADHDLLQDMLCDVEDPAQNERDGMKFSRLVSDSGTPLYVGCKAKHTKLSVTLDLMKLKASNGWTDKSFTDLLGILKAMLPVENTLPETTYEAKQVLCPLGLEVRRIHACPNDCILYHKQYADLDAYPVCKASRYKRKKSADEGNKSKRGGPRQPGNDIDVFLEPVIDDLEILWKEGMETWDAYGQENFKLRVLLFCTINDYPALGNLSGQTIKGKKACSDCKEHTRSRWLKKSRKMVYMGHRSWLPLRHAFRRKKKIFNGKRELQLAPKDLSGDEVHNMVKDISNEFGKKRKRSKTKEKVAIRGILPPKVCHTIQRLCAFFNAIGQKVIDPEVLDGLQTDIVNTLCHLEMFFPVHLVHGSIIEGYTTEKAIEFCVNYMSDADPIGVPASRHEGRLSGVGTIGRKRISPDQASYAQAHYAVLQHMAEGGSYFEEHLAKIRDENLGRSDAWISREHNSRFNEWFKNRVTMSTDVPNEIVQLSGMGPSWTVDTWQGYDINGYTFYTVKQDDKGIVQNSGVRIDAFQDQVGSNTYYDRIEEIWELNYSTDKEGFTLVDLSKVGYADEPFLLAKQVKQIFYIKDPSNKKMHIVRDGKCRIVGVDNVVDEEEYNHNLHVRPHIDLDDDPQEPVAYARSDHTEGITL
uniref:Transposon n=2 Tax=Oryza sativa subsp. japonica TaxID=39947 RepID=Q339W1_ORYSJ|nr:putative transposon [Oryza sativa Japonica Group]ABB47166.1 transposon protein, putative, CACTA, En/Spm sub-class [Oryza sativa Japonica Group]